MVWVKLENFHISKIDCVEVDQKTIIHFLELDSYFSLLKIQLNFPWAAGDPYFHQQAWRLKE